MGDLIKYRMTDETKTVYDKDGKEHTLHRIEYTKEFLEDMRMEPDTRGGFIENEDNLSQDDYALVLDNAIIYGNAKIAGAVELKDEAKVCENAYVEGNSSA